MTAYYNEHDPFAVKWLKELMLDGLIAPGEIDGRDIQDVAPNELRGFRQIHLFAGIGVWSAALRSAGWPDDQPVLTVSCPCQPFSTAGKGEGFADERHLWPAAFHLIGELAPPIVIGEQVASKDGLAWLDLVSADLEAAGYAFGAVDTCAAGFGAPHIRQRLYFAGLADSLIPRLEGHAGNGDDGDESRRDGTEPNGPVAEEGDAVGMEHAARHGRDERGAEPSGRSTSFGCGDGRLEDASCLGRRGRRDGDSARECGALQVKGSGTDGGTGDAVRRPVNGLWRASDWLFCRDGKWRPVEPETFPLAHAGTFRNRVAELRGAGNAVNLAQAKGFIEAVMESGS